MKKTLLLDVDGVIANFKLLYLQCAQEATGRQFDVALIGNDWAYGASLGLTLEQTRATWEHIKEPGRGRNMQPLPGAIEGVKELLKEYEIYFVTAPFLAAPTWCHERHQWLVHHFRETVGHNLVFTEHKYLVRGDCLVDDRPQNVLKWCDANKHKAHLGVLWGTTPSAPSEGQNLHVLQDWSRLRLLLSAQ